MVYLGFMKMHFKFYNSVYTQYWNIKSEADIACILENASFINQTNERNEIFYKPKSFLTRHKSPTALGSEYLPKKDVYTIQRNNSFTQSILVI